MISEIRLISFSSPALAEAVRLFGASNHDRYFSEVRQAFIQPGTPPVVVAEVCGDGSDLSDMVDAVKDQLELKLTEGGAE